MQTLWCWPGTISRCSFIIYAYQTDPTSAFGGIIALNREANAELMQEIIDQQFVEVLIAPKFTKGALGVLQQKKILGFSNVI